MSMLKSLEHNEHAGHMAHGGHDNEGAHGRSGVNPKWSALLVAFLAAGLAISEQGAKHAEIRVQESSILAADAWNQYQAKSTRGTIAADVAAIITAIGESTDPAVMERREKVLEKLKKDQERYEHDPNDGREVIAHRAHEFEHEREHSLEQTHAYHNGSAAMELGIVLATASAIIGSKLLVYIALGLGIAGVTFAFLGYMKPDWGAF